MKQEDQEATITLLPSEKSAEDFKNGGGSPDNDENDNTSTMEASAASSAPGDEKNGAEKEQGDHDKNQPLIAPSGIVLRTAVTALKCTV